MKTLNELNEKVWYRFLKVLYILCYLPYFLVLFMVINFEGKDYHETILPDSVLETLNDPEFYKLDKYQMENVLSSIEILYREGESDGILYWGNEKNTLISKALLDGLVKFKEKQRYVKDKIIEQVKKGPIPTKQLNVKYNYVSHYTYNITKCITYILILTFCYIVLMECIRRGFYYILIGKVFPKE